MSTVLFPYLKCSENKLFSTLYRLLIENKLDDVFLGREDIRTSLKEFSNVDDIVKYVNKTKPKCIYIKRFGENHCVDYFYTNRLVDIRPNKSSVSFVTYVDLSCNKTKNIKFNCCDEELSGYENLFNCLTKLVHDRKLKDVAVSSLKYSKSIKMFMDYNEVIRFIREYYAESLIIVENADKIYPNILPLNRIESFKVNDKSISFTVNIPDFNTKVTKNIQF